MNNYKTQLFLATMVLVLTMSFANAASVVIAEQTFDSGTASWLTSTSGTPTYNTTGGHDGGAHISFVGNIATNTAAFGSALVEFRCQTTGCIDDNSGLFGDWFAKDVTSISYWFKHDSATDIEAYLRVAPVSGVGGAGSALTGILMFPDTWYQITVPLDASAWDPSFGGGNYNNIFAAVGRLQPGIFFEFGTVYNETGVTFSLDDVQLNAVPIPAAFWLMGSALGLLGWMKRRAATVV